MATAKKTAAHVAANDQVKSKTRRFTPEERAGHIDAICMHVSQGKPLSWYTDQPKAPDIVTVYQWLKTDSEADKRFARARELGYDVIAEDALKISDSDPLAVFDESGNKRIDPGEISHRKLQIETRLKLLAKWNPKKYGDKTTIAGDTDSPVKVAVDFGIFDALLQNVALKKLTSE